MCTVLDLPFDEKSPYNLASCRIPPNRELHHSANRRFHCLYLISSTTISTGLRPGSKIELYSPYPNIIWAELVTWCPGDRNSDIKLNWSETDEINHAEFDYFISALVDFSSFLCVSTTCKGSWNENAYKPEPYSEEWRKHFFLSHMRSSTILIDWLGGSSLKEAKDVNYR